MPSIFLTNSTGKTRVIPLAARVGTTLTLGRSEECDIALPEEAHLSRTHCILTIEKSGKVFIQDNNSVNGIYYNARRITAEHMVPGYEYMLGRCVLMLIPDELPAQPAPEENTDSEFFPSEVEVSIPHPSSKDAPSKDAHAKQAPAKKAASGKGGVVLKRRSSPKKKGAAVHRRPGASGAVIGLPSNFALSLRLLNTAPVLNTGTELHFALRAEKDCYVYLMQYDCVGAPTLLVPGVAGEDTRLFADTEVQFPRAFNNEYTLIVEPPCGDEIVIALACTENCHFDKIWQKLCAETPPGSLPGELELQAIGKYHNPKAQWASCLLKLHTVT